MTDTFTGGDETGGTPEENANLKHLREKAAKADEATATADRLARENAFLRSGIDVDSKLGTMFFKSFEGDPADVEGLIKEAREMGIPFRGEGTPPAGDGQQGPEGDGTPPPPQETGTEQRQQLANGAPADTGEQKHPNQVAREIFDKEIEHGTWEDAAGMMIAAKAAAVHRGDLRGTVVQGSLG